MRTIIMIGLLAATMLSAPAMAKKSNGGVKLGKADYFTYKAPKITSDGNVHEQRMNTAEFDLMAKLDDICRVEAAKQNPSAFKTVFLVALRNAPGAFIGGALGATVGKFTGGGITAVNYGAYNGIATVGGSIGAGINAYEMGKHNNVAGCVMALVSDAKRQGYLRQIHVVYNTFPVYGRAIRRSDLPTGTLDAPSEEAGDSDADDTSTRPPGN